MEGRGLPRQFSQWRAFINERSVSYLSNILTAIVNWTGHSLWKRTTETVCKDCKRQLIGWQQAEWPIRILSCTSWSIAVVNVRQGTKNDLEHESDLVLYFKTCILMSQHICLICRVNNIDKTNVLYGVIIVVDSLAKSDPESF